MSFFGSVGNLLTIISNSKVENILIVTLLLTESFLIYFNIKMFKLLENFDIIIENNNNVKNMLKNIIRMISLLGENQQLIYNYIQNHKLQAINVQKTDVPNLNRDDVK